MQLITRVFILAVCVFSAQAIPYLFEHIADAPKEAHMLASQLRTSLIDARALSPAGVACANYYNNATQQIANRLANRTVVCQDTANLTTVMNQRNGNATVNVVRANQLILERNLELCKNQTTNDLYLNCTIANFDANLQILDQNNALAYQIISQNVANTTVVNIQLQNCISAAVSSAKVESIQAANDYDKCLRMAQNQRDSIAPAAVSAPKLLN